MNDNRIIETKEDAQKCLKHCLYGDLNKLDKKLILDCINKGAYVEKIVNVLPGPGDCPLLVYGEDELMTLLLKDFCSR